jgi:predicted RNase H-like HicB family nuclease
MTQGKTLDEARENLIDAILEMQKPVDLSSLPEREVILEEIEV